MLAEFMAPLAGATDLTDNQVRAAVEQLIDPNVSAETKADFLCQLALKGETVEEIAAFARELRDRALSVTLDAETRDRPVLDIVGTGGDKSGTFNISTTVALVCAGAGVTVAKHGNRAATSCCGSADVLETLGVPIDLPPEEAARSLRDHGFAFFFAPRYHPAFKHVAPARKLCAERGQRTIFNFLGPLLNPARPSAQLMGVPTPRLCEPLARVLQSLGVRRAMVVCGRAGKAGEVVLDELSTLGANIIAEFYQERALISSTLEITHFPIQPATLADLAGKDRETNARIVLSILNGFERGPKRDAVLLNAAAGLFVAGVVNSLTAGWEMAASVIDHGHAIRKLTELTQA